MRSMISSVTCWIEAAIRVGVRFYRIAAGGVPPASVHFEPHGRHAKPGCCAECGCVHPALVDEYYFWLLDALFFQAVNNSDSPSFTIFEQDDYYDPFTQASTLWHDPAQQPGLLEWTSSPIVRLAWCRVHNGEFKQPRRSYAGVQVIPGGSTPDLTFLGREADSLVFQVSNGVVPTGYNGTDGPGFRYDLATDTAVVLPLVEDPAPAASTFPGGLPAYPYFAYVGPGAVVSETYIGPYTVPVRVGAQMVCTRVQPARAGRYVDSLPAAYANSRGRWRTDRCCRA